MRVLRVVACGCLLVGAIGLEAADDDAAARAARHGRQATRALVVSNRIMHGWLARRDATTGLLPHRGTFKGSQPDPSWVVANTAADLYPFMVMAARLTEPAVYHGAMLDILRQETLLTTRVGRLSDDVKGDGRFVRAAPDLDAIIFGSSEYMKDGLVPLTELFGDTPRWGDTLRPFLWTHVSTMVTGFTGSTEIDLPVECTYDFEVAAAKYLHGLDTGWLARDGQLPVRRGLLRAALHGLVWQRLELPEQDDLRVHERKDEDDAVSLHTRRTDEAVTLPKREEAKPKKITVAVK